MGDTGHEPRRAVRFWDQINGSPEEAHPIGGEGATLALLEYAEDDHDGLTDGLYVNQSNGGENPHPFVVEYSDGTTEVWHVYGEMSVDFHVRAARSAGEGVDDG